MAAAQDGTFTCAGHMEGTGSQKTQPTRFGYECILSCASDTDRTTRQARQRLMEGPSDGTASEEDRGGKQPPRLRLSRHAESRRRQVEPVGDLLSRGQARVSWAVFGSEAQHSRNIPADAHGHRAQPG